MNNHIHPNFGKIINREEREIFLNQRSLVIWLTGLSGSGKSTIAACLERKLLSHNYFAQVLDGDNIRSGINKDLTFTEKDRTENIRRIAEISKLYIHSGIICINSFISPTRESRKLAREIIGEDSFFEVYVNAPLEVCEKRDVKGLYKKARSGEIKNFTGIDAAYETPVNADIELHTSQQSIEESVSLVYKSILTKIKYHS